MGWDSHECNGNVSKTFLKHIFGQLGCHRVFTFYDANVFMYTNYILSKKNIMLLQRWDWLIDWFQNVFYIAIMLKQMIKILNY